ncbi:MAG TPA: DUF222 domain-containing protein [Jatrophihabitans sp.]|jgi:hypothetical protein
MADGQAWTVEQLLALDPAGCSRDEVFDGLIELDRLVSRAQARRERLLAAVHQPDEPKQWAREEVACALGWSLGFTEARLAQATHLVSTLPKILALHEKGSISEAHARAATEATYGLTPEMIAAVQDRVLARAPLQSVTQFRAALRRAVARLDPRGEHDKHQAAKAQRLVRLSPLPDGMAGLWPTHTAVDAEAIYARLTDIAQTMGHAGAGGAAGSGEGIDARRADTLRDLILDTTTGVGSGTVRAPARHARIQLLVPQATATGDSDAPGELAGYGPIPASQCRDLLTDPTTRIDRVTVDPAGRVLPVGVIEHPPGACPPPPKPAT